MNSVKENNMTEIKILFGSSLKPGEAEVIFSPEWFAHDSVSYDHNLGRFSALVSMIGYDMSVPEDENSLQNKGIKKMLEAIGMDTTETYGVSLREEVNYVLSHGKYDMDGRESDLIICAFIGSRLEQWYDNFDSGTGATHKGFQTAENFVYGKLTEFINTLGIEKESTKILITGHSRGGAVANLLGVHLIKEEKFALKENTFTYTFAAPAATILEEKDAPEFRRIFNIVNEEDFVTRCMPREWGYGRYGITYALPNKENTENYEEVLGEMNKIFTCYDPDDTYKPFRDGPAAVDKLFALLSEHVRNVFEFYHTTYRCAGKMMSLQEYFTKTLCGITAEPSGTRKNTDATVFMMMTSVRRLGSHPVAKAIADFFIFNEGIGGATKSTVSDTYFSYSHNIDSYCAYMMSIDEKQFMAVQLGRK